MRGTRQRLGWYVRAGGLLAAGVIGVGLSLGVPDGGGCGGAGPMVAPTAAGALWVNAYYTAKDQDETPPSTVDFAALTQITHFAIVPTADGTVDQAAHGLTDARARALTQAAHAAKVAALVSVGGAESASAFRAALAAVDADTIASHVVDFVVTNGYDGVDVDWEPLDADDARAYESFVFALRATLDERVPRARLTTAVSFDVEPALVDALREVEPVVDQINVMAYGMGKALPGWPTWHSGPLRDGGATFGGSSKHLPSIDASIHALVAAGMPAGKLGLGMSFHGFVWHGVSGPNEDATDAWNEAVRYDQLLRQYGGATYVWNEDTQAAHLSVASANPADQRFVSYDDERACAAKVAYASNAGLGGVMIWHLAQGYRPAADVRDPLLQAVRRATGR